MAATSDRLYAGALYVQIVALLAGFVAFFLLLERRGLGPAVVAAASALVVLVAATGIRRRIERDVRSATLKLVRDDVLGEMRWEDEGWWKATVATGDFSLSFMIGGSGRPAASLVAHARELVGAPEAFATKVRSFLEREVASQEHLRPFVDEISTLRIEAVSLSDPAKPHDGMIWFGDVSSGRLWRCDYRDGEPTGLGFDS